MQKNIYRDILFGVAVGDALGVPVEFKSRSYLKENPVTDMIGYGTYNLPPGTFSDDSSLTFCLAEALTHEFDLQKIADYFVAWAYGNFWTPHGKVFDIGIATSQAIGRIRKGINPELAGGLDESSNGNGSLMRILPLILYIHNKPIDERFAITKQVSSITHGHIRSVIACFYYLEFVKLLIDGKSKFEAYLILQNQLSTYLQKLRINQSEISFFDRILKNDIKKLNEGEISSTGYVLHTLEASIWCLLTTENYEDAVLKAINLGSDTDTTGAVTGGLAGILYGSKNISNKWITNIAKRVEIEDLAHRLESHFHSTKTV
jgi:ADP-ribosylglycohydrolase